MAKKSLISTKKSQTIAPRICLFLSGVLGESSRQALRVTRHPNSPGTAGNEASVLQLCKCIWEFLPHSLLFKLTGQLASNPMLSGRVWSGRASKCRIYIFISPKVHFISDRSCRAVKITAPRCTYVAVYVPHFVFSLVCNRSTVPRILTNSYMRHFVAYVPNKSCPSNCARA